MIKVYNRHKKEYEIENVAGEKYLKWNYESPVGMSVLEAVTKKKLFSKIYGSYCDTKLSKRKINRFINNFDIDMSISVKKANEFGNFNDFFIRKLIETARPIDKNSNALVSPGDGRLSVFENIDMENVIQIKGYTYSLKELIGNAEIANEYNGGICLLLRLCPLDYHRFHFVDNGTCSETNKITGHYYSVNPIALEKIPGLFCQNKREWCIFHSENFGDILHVEVGATCVGTIIQSYKPNETVKKGSEKGYFKFGGSTTILFLKKDSVQIDRDIVEQTSLGYETRVLMGEKIGIK